MVGLNVAVLFNSVKCNFGSSTEVLNVCFEVGTPITTQPSKTMKKCCRYEKESGVDEGHRIFWGIFELQLPIQEICIH